MNAITTTHPTVNPLVPHDMTGAMQLANMMSKGNLVPSHLRDSPGDCLMVIEQAMRWNMSPFAVAQCTSVIQGKLMFEGKLVSAALHTSGLLESRLREEFSGEGPARAIVLRGTIRGETSAREIKVTLAEAKTSNGMWTKQPDQQLVYFATRAWARRHAPEVMLGVYAPEDFDANRAAPSASDEFAGTTIDAAPLPAEPAVRRPTITQWLDALDAELRGVYHDPEAVDAILARDDVQKAQDTLRNGAKARLEVIITEAIAATRATETSAPVENDPGGAA